MSDLETHVDRMASAFMNSVDKLAKKGSQNLDSNNTMIYQERVSELRKGNNADAAEDDKNCEKCFDEKMTVL